MNKIVNQIIYQEEEAKKVLENAAKEELKKASLKKLPPPSNPAMVSFAANPSTSKVILIHPVQRDQRDQRDYRDPKISSKSIRNDLKITNPNHKSTNRHKSSQGAQITQQIPNIDIKQIPPFKKVNSQAPNASNLLPNVHMKNEKSQKKSRSFDKKNLVA